jgi:hypothetical protein
LRRRCGQAALWKKRRANGSSSLIEQRRCRFRCRWLRLRLSEITKRCSGGTNAPRAVTSTRREAIGAGALVASTNFTLAADGSSAFHQVLEMRVEFLQRSELTTWVTIQVSVDVF